MCPVPALDVRPPLQSWDRNEAHQPTSVRNEEETLALFCVSAISGDRHRHENRHPKSCGQSPKNLRRGMRPRSPDCQMTKPSSDGSWRRSYRPRGSYSLARRCRPDNWLRCSRHNAPAGCWACSRPRLGWRRSGWGEQRTHGFDSKRCKDLAVGRRACSNRWWARSCGFHVQIG